MFFELLFFVLVSGTLFYMFYKWATVNKDYFIKRRMKQLEPVFLVGHTFGLLTNRYEPTEFLDSIYNRYPDEKLIGMFDGRQPTYFARDVDFLRQITIKDFDHFEDHIGFIDPEGDSLFGKGLFFLYGKKWRDMRTTLSPAFTGSKMRHMFELVVECAEDLVKYLSNDAKQGEPIRWEIKELFSHYTSDVIASCAFGLKVDSLKDRTNEFFVIGKDVLNFSKPSIVVRMLLIRAFPKLMRAINVEVMSGYVRRFFKTMVVDTMEEREKKQITRPDMINILMQVRSGNLKHQPNELNSDDMGFATTEESNIHSGQVKRAWTEDELVAQCFIFFAAGFDTASTMMSFFAYELALHPDIQQKVYEEIRAVNAELNGSRLTYDALAKLKYLDQVISEVLRKWPPALFTNRKCTKDYEFDYNGRKIPIERGVSVWIPIYSIHHDPSNYSDPEKFDPERFNDENKHKIKSGAFLPFGTGPRNCIGSRFALMEIKALFFYLLLNFNIQPYEKTQIPVKIKKAPANLATQEGIHLELQKRS